MYTILLQGFYGVYGSVFQRIADEEAQYMDEVEELLPLFGKLLYLVDHKTYTCMCNACICNFILQVTQKVNMKR